MSATRRQFLAAAVPFALVAAGMGRGRAAMGPNAKFDLVIKGGDVLDPSQNLRGKRDIGIRFGMIEALEPDIPAARAQKLLDAAGRLVTPGLVDLHTHVYPYGSAIGIPADELVPHQGTTTCVSAGDAGANNFAALRRSPCVSSRRARVQLLTCIAGKDQYARETQSNPDLPQRGGRAPVLGEPRFVALSQLEQGSARPIS